jgi:hypothetical protein
MRGIFMSFTNMFLEYEPYFYKYYMLLFVTHFVLPGLIAMFVYRHIFPAGFVEWQNAFSEGAFCGSALFIVTFVLVTLPALIGYRFGFSCPLWILVVIMFFAELMLAIVAPFF